MDEYHPVYRCGCSRERVLSAFAAMTPEDRRELPDEEGNTEATCRFCDRVYHFTLEELENLSVSSEGQS